MSVAGAWGLRPFSEAFDCDWCAEVTLLELKSVSKSPNLDFV